MNLEGVFAYWRFPPWLWAAFIGAFVGYLGIIIKKYHHD